MAAKQNAHHSGRAKCIVNKNGENDGHEISISIKNNSEKQRRSMKKRKRRRKIERRRQSGIAEIHRRLSIIAGIMYQKWA